MQNFLRAIAAMIKALFMGMTSNLAPPGFAGMLASRQPSPVCSGACLYGLTSTSMPMRTFDDTDRHHRLRGPTRSRIEHLAAFAANLNQSYQTFAHITAGTHHEASPDLSMTSSPAVQIAIAIDQEVTPRDLVSRLVSSFTNTWATITGFAHAANHPFSVLTGS